MNAIRVIRLCHYPVREVKGQSSDVDSKSMFYIACLYMSYYVSPNSEGVIKPL